LIFKTILKYFNLLSDKIDYENEKPKELEKRKHGTEGKVKGGK
jgi:hypothetical protein